jgi:hypothetical protein
MRGLRCLGVVLALAGCYTYRPISTTTPEQGTRVSTQLTGQGSVDMAGQIGPDILHVEGDVVDADSTGLELVVREVETFRGIRSDWHGEHVRIPSGAVAGMQERRLSLGGTGLMGGVMVAGLYTLYRVLGGPGLLEGNDGQSGGGGR